DFHLAAGAACDQWLDQTELTLCKLQTLLQAVDGFNHLLLPGGKELALQTDDFVVSSDVGIETDLFFLVTLCNQAAESGSQCYFLSFQIGIFGFETCFADNGQNLAL